jgi:hypothetical protein
MVPGTQEAKALESTMEVHPMEVGAAKGGELDGDWSLMLDGLYIVFYMTQLRLFIAKVVG